MFNPQPWLGFLKGLFYASLTISFAAGLSILVYYNGHNVWHDTQRAYLDVKELNELRLLPAELAKREASLVKAEKRVKALEAALFAKSHGDKKVQSSPNAKALVAKANIPRAAAPVTRGWFARQRALYRFVNTCYRDSPEVGRITVETEKRVKAMENGVSGTKDLKKDLNRAETQIKELEGFMKELKARVKERCGEAKAQIKEITKVAKGLEAQVI